MITRRNFVLGSAAAALGAGALRAETLGLVPDLRTDQSAAFFKAVSAAAAEGRALHLPAGRYRVADVELPEGAVLTGVPGHSVLEVTTGEVILFGGADGIRLSGLTFLGRGKESDAPRGLVTFEQCADFAVNDCSFVDAPARSLSLFRTGGRVQNCRIRGSYGAAVGGRDCDGVQIEGNDIADCANLGIYLERGSVDQGGNVVRGNRIARIGWARGGNGEVGNGINLYREGGTVITGNAVSDCAFSAIRLNDTQNVVVADNTCLRSGEVAVFSEFGFSGSVIEGNVIDTAVGGISMTNLDAGGRVAACSGNVIRNIQPMSETNPDSSPYGILAEAEVALTGNVIEGVPGPAMILGWGPYLRNVSATGNVISDSDVGIAVSVVDGVGETVITGNRIAAREGGIVGMAWSDVKVPDLVAAASNHPLVTLSGNSVSVGG